MINYVLIISYAILMIFWIVLLFINGKKAQAMLAPLDQKKYALKAIYPVGFNLLELIHYSYNTSLDKTRLAQAKIVYGEKYGEYYYRINVIEKVSYAYSSIVIAPLIGILFGNPILCLFGFFLAGVLFYYGDSKITDIIKEREVEITRDFCDMVSKMALLINAGMITREAWEQISVTGKGTLYDEMRNSLIEMQNGTSEIDAYIRFGNRCGVQLVNKFISMLVQNLSKGNKELVEFLKAETEVCWEEKKHLVKRQGESASSKLMLPMGLIFVGIFVMILVPIVSKIGF